MINIGLVGLGHIGHYHIQTLAAIDQFNLVAAIDKNSELKQLLPQGVIFFDNVGDFFASDFFNTVVIATPNNTHYEYGKMAYEAGKNVIMEKPAASTMAEFDELNSSFHAGQHQHIYYAFHAAKAFEVSWFKQYLRDRDIINKLGPVTAFSCHFFDPYFSNGRLAEAARGLDNPWLDSGVNALSVLAELMSVEDLQVEDVFSSFSNASTIQVQAQFRFPIAERSGRGLGIINTNWAGNLNHKKTLLVFGLTGHAAELNHSAQKVFLTKPDGMKALLQDFSSSGRRLYNHYIGVFKDYLACFKKGNYNQQFARRVHDKLFSVENRRIGK